MMNLLRSTRCKTYVKLNFASLIEFIVMRLYRACVTIVASAGYRGIHSLKNESPPLASLCIFMGLPARTSDAHRGLTTMNVHWIESSTVASPIPILLMHSAGIRLRRKARRDTLWKLSIDEKAAAHPAERRFRLEFSLPHVKSLRAVRININLFIAINFPSSIP